jgi:IclR family transcriptional regulator, acetate operon repressor
MKASPESPTKRSPAARKRVTAGGPDAADEEAGGSSSIQGVERALSVLTLFASSESRTLGVTEISRSLGLSKAVVYRILTACRAKGFLELEPATHRYMLGPQILAMGLIFMNRIDAQGIIREEMSKLSAQTNETATFSVRAGWQRVYVDQVTPDRDIKMVVQIGRMYPLHTGASSRALLAALPEAEQEQYIAEHELTGLASNSITDARRLRETLVEVRERGYAVSIRERDDGAASVAAAIYGHADRLIGVISVSGPAERFQPEIESAAAALCATVERIAVRLGRWLPGS